MENIMIDPKFISWLQGYCIRAWKSHGLPIDTHDDCTQDVFARISKSIPQADWEKIGELESEERREFLRAIDATQHKERRYLQGGSKKYKRTTLYDLVYFRDDPSDIAQENETKRVLILCIRGLSLKQRLILLLSLRGLDQTEISERTGIEYRKIKDHKYKALAKLRQDERLLNYA